MKVELHCHSHYSVRNIIHCEGLNSPAELIRSAKRMGLGGIAITDHKVTDGWPSAAREAKKQGIVFIPGMEIETMEGHVIGLGLNQPVRNYLSVRETIDRIHKQGGLAVAPHPYDVMGEGIGDSMKHADLAEVFSSLNIEVSNHIARVRAKNLGKPFCVGSDAHTLDMVGLSQNIVEADDLDSVLRQLKLGKASFKTEYVPPKLLVRWVRERFARSYGNIVTYINSNYSYPRASISKFLLDRFVYSDNRIWNWIAQFSMDMTRMYGFVTMVKYY